MSKRSKARPPVVATRHPAIRNEAMSIEARNEANSITIGGEIMIYGAIDAWEVRALDVIAALSELNNRDTINVRINSPGGSVYEGLAMYDALRMASAKGKKIVIRVDAIAASIASVVAMAADELVFAEDARLMIHNPYAYSGGEADELRKLADELDNIRDRIVTIYSRKAGDKITPEQLIEMMNVETYLSAQEAFDLGLCDRVDVPLKVAARLPDTENRTLGYLLSPATINAKENETMPKLRPTGNNPRNEVDPAAAAAAAAAVAPAAQPVPAAIVGETATDVSNRVRTDTLEILNICRSANIENHNDVARDMISRGITPDAARTEIFNKLFAEQPGGQTVPANPRREGTDVSERFRAGAIAALAAKAGLPGGERNEFSGMTLSEIARHSLTIHNVRIPHDRLGMVGEAFTFVPRNAAGMHSTSDFATLLGTTVNASLLRGFNEVEETFQTWTQKGTASDFRAQNRVDLGLFPALAKVEEGAEFTYGTMGENGQSVMIGTYGKMFAITRQAIINDNLNAFTKVPAKMGRAARRTIGNLVFAILTGNPTMSDGVALFHSTHGNLAASGAVVSITSLAAARVAMSRQKDRDGISNGGGFRPAYLLCPPEIADNARVVIASEFSDYNTRAPNPIRNFVEVIEDPRLTGTAWYLVAAESVADTIEVTYLDGVETPFLDQRIGWNVDGTEWKVRIDVGATPLDWRGMYKNPGA